MSITGSRRTRGAGDGIGSTPAALTTNRIRSLVQAPGCRPPSVREHPRRAPGVRRAPVRVDVRTGSRCARAVLPDADAGWARFAAWLPRLSIPRSPCHSDADAEYRWEVWSGFDAALFYDAGKVALRRSDLNFKGLEDAYGFGFRFNNDNGTILRIDAGFGSRDGKHLYIVFGDVF